MEATAETESCTPGDTRKCDGIHGLTGKTKTTKNNAAEQNNRKYEHETETWHCAKCDKSYTSQNARSARAHAEEHTKQKKKREEQGKTSYSNTIRKTRMEYDYVRYDDMGKTAEEKYRKST